MILARLKRIHGPKCHIVGLVVVTLITPQHSSPGSDEFLGAPTPAATATGTVGSKRRKGQLGLEAS